MIKKILITLAIVFGLTVLIVIWGVTRVKKSYKLMEQGAVQSFEEIVRVPFSYSGSGHIIIPLRFGADTTSYPFIFDTGASNMLFEHFPYVDQYKKVGKSIAKGAGGHFMLNDIREISTVKFGGVDFNKLCFEIVAFDWPCWSKVYGIFGKEAMRHLSWQIDYKKQIILFSDSIANLNISEDAHKIKLRENKFSHHLYLNLTASNNQIRSVLFDTGSSGGISFKTKYDAFEESISDMILILGKQSKGIGDYSKSTERLVKYDTLYLNDKLYFNDAWVHSSESALNAVGTKFLENFIITFNWDDKILYLEQQVDSLTLNEKRFGFTATYRDGEAVIASVLEYSHAYEQGIRPNQKILRLNEVNINSEEDYCQLTISDYDTIFLALRDTTYREFELKCFKENLDLVNY